MTSKMRWTETWEERAVREVGGIVDVPEGKSGEWEVQRFTIDKAAALHSMFRYRDRFIPPGTYTWLKGHNQSYMSDTPAEVRDHRELVWHGWGDVLVFGDDKVARDVVIALADDPGADLRGIVPRSVDLVREILALRLELQVAPDPPASLAADLAARKVGWLALAIALLVFGFFLFVLHHDHRVGRIGQPILIRYGAELQLEAGGQGAILMGGATRVGVVE